MVSLQERLDDLTVALGTDYKLIMGKIGELTSLTTTNKTSLVAAINEVKSLADSAAGGGVAINDAAPSSTTTTYSGNKIESLSATAVKKTGAESIDGVKTFTSAPVVPDASFTIAKTNGLSSALAGKAVIDDNSSITSATTTYSALKINTAIDNALTALVNGAGAAMDTLSELAAALGNDANFATTTATALGKRVRVDAAQVFTTNEKAQARANIDAYGSVELGDPDTNLVSAYNAAKV